MCLDNVEASGPSVSVISSSRVGAWSRHGRHILGSLFNYSFLQSFVKCNVSLSRGVRGEDGAIVDGYCVSVCVV